jgi:hypothetical protein
LTHPNMMIVDCSALYEVDFLSSQFRFFETEFFYSVNVNLWGGRPLLARLSVRHI